MKVGFVSCNRADTNYRLRARYFQKTIAQTRRLDVAAYAIERAFENNQRMDSSGERAEFSHV